MSDDTRRFYDLIAPHTADEWYPNEVLLPTLRDFLSLLPASPRVLDLGCGPGYESMRLARLGAQVVGIDYSPESLRIARERCQGCAFYELDMRGLDARWGTFDGVLASASLIHVAPDELAEVLGRVAAILNSGGRLLAIVREGTGKREWRLTVEGVELTRTIYQYRGEDLAAAGLTYEREAWLDPQEYEHGWRAHLYRRVIEASGLVRS